MHPAHPPSGNHLLSSTPSACAGHTLQGGSDQPLSYSAFGAACAEVEIDVLTGDRIIHRVDILFDCGHSFNPAIDVGQVEPVVTQPPVP